MPRASPAAPTRRHALILPALSAASALVALGVPRRARADEELPERKIGLVFQPRILHVWVGLQDLFTAASRERLTSGFATRVLLDEYFRSGDLAVVESDGMIRIVGRRSVDIIKSRGFKISAVEIENCLQAHPAVAEVAVVGVPDADQGEVVTAVITTTAGATLSADDVRGYARANLAPPSPGSTVLACSWLARAAQGTNVGVSSSRSRNMVEK